MPLCCRRPAHPLISSQVSPPAASILSLWCGSALYESRGAPGGQPAPDARSHVVWGCVALSLLGLVMVGSASIEYAEVKQGSPWHYQIRHGVYWFMAAGAGVFAALFHPVGFSNTAKSFWCWVCCCCWRCLCLAWVKPSTVQLAGSTWLSSSCRRPKWPRCVWRFISRASWCALVPRPPRLLGFFRPDCDRSVWRFTAAGARLGCLCHHVWHGAVRAVFAGSRALYWFAFLLLGAALVYLAIEFAEYRTKRSWSC